MGQSACHSHMLHSWFLYKWLKNNYIKSQDHPTSLPLLPELLSQWAHNVKMTSYQRRCDVITSHRRLYDVILMLCACWDCSQRNQMYFKTKTVGKPVTTSDNEGTLNFEKENSFIYEHNTNKTTDCSINSMYFHQSFIETITGTRYEVQIINYQILSCFLPLENNVCINRLTRKYRGEKHTGSPKVSQKRCLAYGYQSLRLRLWNYERFR